MKSVGLFLVRVIVFVCVFWSLWIFVFRPLSSSISGGSSASQSQDEQALQKKYWDQAREADRLQAKYREQAAIADEQLKRMNALLTAREQQTKRFDEVLRKWEQQPELKK